VERRNTIPILSNVLIEAAKGRLKLTATDLDIEIVEIAPRRCASQRGGDRAGPHALRPSCARCPKARRSRPTDRRGFGAAVGLGRQHPLRAGLPTAGGFPAKCRPAALPHRFRLAASELDRADRKKQRFAISTEETRFYLNGQSSGTRQRTANRPACAPWRRTATGWRVTNWIFPIGAKDIPA